jgi:hypothetical protein
MRRILGSMNAWSTNAQLNARLTKAQLTNAWSTNFAIFIKSTNILVDECSVVECTGRRVYVAPLKHDSFVTIKRLFHTLLPRSPAGLDLTFGVLEAIVQNQAIALRPVYTKHKFVSSDRFLCRTTLNWRVSFLVVRQNLCRPTVVSSDRKFVFRVNTPLTGKTNVCNVCRTLSTVRKFTLEMFFFLKTSANFFNSIDIFAFYSYQKLRS